MRRFRWRRRRLGAIALASLAALTTTSTLTGAAETAGKASIDSSAGTVPYGKKVTLRGSFPDAPKTRVAIHHRADGAKTWKPWTTTRTGAGGRWSARVAPRKSGSWRAVLAGRAKTQSAPQPGVLPGQDPAETGDPSTGAERIRVRSRTRATVAGRHTKVGRTVHVRGRVLPAGEKRRVVVQIGKREITTRAGRDGEFDVGWEPSSTGSYPVRVKARGNRLAGGSKDSAGKITAYRPAAASWYGPGLYGNRMACGGTLTPSTLGVAHKTMPCGTKLRLKYGGRTVAVRVVDRGPYSGSREFDLTSATKQRLGFPDTGTVWTSK